MDLATPFGNLSTLIRQHAAARAAASALMQDDRVVSYGELDRAMDSIAAGFQERGLQRGDRVSICAPNSIDYAVAMMAVLRAGGVPALIPPSVSDEARAAMHADSGAEWLIDESRLATLPASDAAPREHVPRPGDAFNIIYSSGTTGAPKGIVQPHAMRWAHMQRGPAYDYDERSITLLSTPLYSNTTLVSFFPTLAVGGCAVLMAKFDPASYLALAQRHRATHTMLVPVQYQRLMAFEAFERYDLASFRMKFSTSAPFGAPLKEQVLERWPGGLVEFYGMTEGGATCVLAAHVDRHKLATVGKPGTGVEVVLLDEEGREVAAGEPGEVAGHSAAMMTGYHNRPRETAEAEWFDARGRRYIRTGDVGRFDAEGFLTLVDRRKDMIISGGFNIYPSDLEAVLRSHPAVRDVAVVGVPSERWGETPVAFVVPAGKVDAAELREWANARLGKLQRLAAVELIDELPRSPIGKVLKRELREGYSGSGG
jgi:long-chain acyl-CoA synthetase